jgi:DNA topoisomerase-1
MPKPLVIVESPAKARTIAKFLGPGYEVEASIGHIRDLPSNAAEIPASHKALPWSRLGVDIDAGFVPLYVVPADKKAKIRELKAKLKGASALYLATDEDREGEAISWHLLALLEPKVPVKRMVFHEITKAAIHEAIENCRDVDTALVDAQEARRILDRLYGYEVSPVLWRKIAPRLSAGRVQSVATRLIVEREKERIAFVPARWWDAKVVLEHKGTSFPAEVTALDGVTLAQGRDFGPDGKLTRDSNVQVLDEAKAKKLSDGLQGAHALTTAVEEDEYNSKPKAPFTTSTYQQEAGRKLGMAAKRAMQAAQRLYENGYITYMRTDSITLSEQAINAARELVTREYGKEYLPATPRTWTGKSRNAQEAHEAIRPAGDHFRFPKEVAGEVGGDEAAVYDLIWKRTVASQMVDARMKSVTARFNVPLKNGGKADLVARGKTVLFPGYLRAYVEGHDEPEAELEEQDVVLPPLVKGDQARVESSEPVGHTTKPPARFTEAALVQKMEELGIGRPSTYASIIGTITDREYVVKRGQALVPTPLAFAVVQLMQDLEPALVDYGFTAEMEEHLDQISRGELDRNDFLARFWSGKEPGLKRIVTTRANKIDPRVVNTIPLGVHEGKPVSLRVGRYGPYIECEDVRASVPEGLAPDEITIPKALELLAAAGQAEEPLGTGPGGQFVYLRVGRFGPYVQLGEDPEDKKDPKPKRASLFKSMSPKTVTLEQALQLLSLPRKLGEEADGSVITARPGRFGPYLEKVVPGQEKPETRSLQSEEQLLSITLDEARAIFAIPKRGRGRGPAAPPLKELGVDPTSGTPIVIKDGKYGPYASDGETNASLPKGTSVEECTLQIAINLLADRRAAAPPSKKKKKTTKRAAKPETDATAEKTPAKKKATRKKAKT